MSTAIEYLDRNGQAIEIGDKFIKNDTIEIFEVIGYKDDGRIRCRQAIVNFGGNPYAPPKPYGSTDALIGPVYLFFPHQVLINKQWAK